MTLDARALDEMYRRHGAMVRRRARALLGNEDDAQDALQEIFASLSARPEQFQERSSPSTFLYAMTTHHCLNRIRDRKNRARLVALHVTPRDGDKAADAAGERLAILRDLLARLPQDLGEVAVYSHVDGMSHAEIADLLGCSKTHVGNQLARFHEQANQLLLAPRRAG